MPAESGRLAGRIKGVPGCWPARCPAHALASRPGEPDGLALLRWLGEHDARGVNVRPCIELLAGSLLVTAAMAADESDGLARLTGILVSPKSAVALIDGQLYRQGDTIGDARIVAIDEGSIRIASGGSEIDWADMRTRFRSACETSLSPPDTGTTPRLLNPLMCQKRDQPP